MEAAAPINGISALLLSLMIIPIATELPEKVNSILWIRKDNDTLAFGNITGAMVFQGTLLPAIGISLTPWAPQKEVLLGDDAELVSADLTGLPPSAETALATEKNSHCIDQIVDALAVQNLLSRLNPSLTLAQLTRVYAAASRQPGTTDERIVEALSTIVLGDPSPLPVGEAADIAGAASFDARIALHDRILSIQQRLPEVGGLTLQSLIDPRNADVVAKAGNDVATATRSRPCSRSP